MRAQGTLVSADNLSSKFLGNTSVNLVRPGLVQAQTSDWLALKTQLLVIHGSLAPVVSRLDTAPY